MAEKKKVRQKAKIVLSPEEDKLVAQLRKKRQEMDKLRKEMADLEEKIRPLANKRVAEQKVKKAGLSLDEIAAIAGSKK